MRHSECRRTSTSSPSPMSPVDHRDVDVAVGCSKAWASNTPYGVGSGTRTISAAIIAVAPTRRRRRGKLRRSMVDATGLWFVAPATWRSQVGLPRRRDGRGARADVVLGHQRGHRDAGLPGRARPRPAGRRDDRGARRHVPLPVPLRLQLRRRGRGEPADVAVGTLVFAFQPHQDRFVAAAGDVVRCRSAIARRRRCSRSSRRPCRSPSTPDRCSARRSSCSGSARSAADGAAAAARRRPRRRGRARDGVAPDWPLRRCGRARRWRRRRHSTWAACPARHRGVRQPGGPAGGAAVARATRARSSSRRGTGRRRSRCRSGEEFHRRRLTIRSTQVSTIPASLADRWDRERRRRAAVDAARRAAARRAGDPHVPFDEAATPSAPSTRPRD